MCRLVIHLVLSFERCDCIDAEGSACLPCAPAALHTQQPLAHQTDQLYTHNQR